MQRVLLPDLNCDLGISPVVEGETEQARRKKDTEKVVRARKFLMYWCRRLLKEEGLELQCEEQEFAEQVNFRAVIRSEPYDSFGYSFLARLCNVTVDSSLTKTEAALAR